MIGSLFVMWIVLGMTFFFMMLIVLYVIRKSVAIPLQMLKIAVEKISVKDYDFVIDGKLKLADSVANEMGLLVKAFCQMPSRSKMPIKSWKIKLKNGHKN